MKKKNIPTTDEILDAIMVLDKLNKTKLMTEHEKTALAVVSDALVAISDPNNLHRYDGLTERAYIRVKVWYDEPSKLAKKMPL